MTERGRYDGLADWYDTAVTEGHAAGISALARRLMVRMLPAGGGGRCLDLACGGGQHAATLASIGWRVVGSDISADQLRVARDRGVPVAQADAGAQPWPSGAFGAVATIMTSSDVDDFGGVVREAVRVLQPGGVFVAVGAHPCFGVAPEAYRTVGRLDADPAWGAGIRSRVGYVQVPLPVWLNTVAEAGLRIEETADDDGPENVPNLFGLRART